MGLETIKKKEFYTHYEGVQSGCERRYGEAQLNCLKENLMWWLTKFVGVLWRYYLLLDIYNTKDWLILYNNLNFYVPYLGLVRHVVWLNNSKWDLPLCTQMVHNILCLV